MRAFSPAIRRIPARDWACPLPLPFPTGSPHRLLPSPVPLPGPPPALRFGDDPFDSGDDELAVAADLFDFPAVRGDLGYDDLNLIASDFHHDNGSDCDVARVAHTYLLLVV